MKIVKEVGERLLPSWLRAELRPVLAVTGAGTSLVSGSAVLAGRAWQQLREHLDLRESIAALLVAGYVTGYGCWHAPHIARFAIPGALIAWCAAAWWHAPPSRPAPAADPSDTEPDRPPMAAPEDVYKATLEWIWQHIGDTQGVHLRDLLASAQAAGMFEDLDVTQFRGHLERWQIPVRSRVRVRGKGITVGVYRDDLPALPSPSPESGAENPPDSELHAA